MIHEKRISQRIPARIIASCQTNDHVSSARKDFFFYTKDISLNGARFVAPENMQIGQHLSFNLELPTCFIPLMIHGRVAWLRKSDPSRPEDKVIEGGIKFIRMEFRDHDKLNSFVNAKTGHPKHKKGAEDKGKKAERRVPFFTRYSGALWLSLLHGMSL